MDTATNCKICHNPINKQLLANKKIYHHCTNCDFTYLDLQFHLSPAAEKQRYDQHQNSSDNSRYTEILKAFIDEAISPYPITKILDYGCGPNPVLANILKSQGYQVDIYDPFYAPDAPSDTYELISSTEVFEHLAEPLESCKQILKLLKPNGYLALMTKFICPIDEFANWRYKDDTTHISFYSPRTFSEIARILDLDLIKHNSKDIVVLRT